VDDPLTLNHIKLILDFTAGQRLPSVHVAKEFAAAGGPKTRTAGCNDFVPKPYSPQENSAVPALNWQSIAAVRETANGTKRTFLD
jgi:hypothetical protein